MNHRIKLFTDSAADVPDKFVEKYDIGVVPLSVIFNEIEYKDKVTISTETFYQKLRTEKELPSTNQVNPQEFQEAFQPWVEAGVPILYLGISLKLSGTVQSAQIAKDLLKAETIHIFDTKSASLGEGIQVIRAAEMIASGKDITEIVETLDEYRRQSLGLFVLNSLEHLVKGGRLSRTQGLLGSLLNIKPLLSFQENGEIGVIEKVRSQRKALQNLIDRASAQGRDFSQVIMGIAHTNDLELAQELESMVQKQLKPKQTIIGIVGPTIGTHTGPGGVGLFF